MGDVGEEEAHVAVALYLPRGGRELREGWGQVLASCSVVGSRGGGHLHSGSMLAYLVSQPLTHPQPEYVVCPCVEFYRRLGFPPIPWIAMAGRRAGEILGSASPRPWPSGWFQGKTPQLSGLSVCLQQTSFSPLLPLPVSICTFPTSILVSKELSVELDACRGHPLFLIPTFLSLAWICLFWLAWDTSADEL